MTGWVLKGNMLGQHLTNYAVHGLGLNLFHEARDNRRR
jgi:hypothetical protein